MSRKIEQRMNAAIIGKLNWCEANTQVCWDAAGQVSEVYLHGNLIARIGESYLQLFDGDHQSKTTKSRIQAILEVHGNGQDRIYQKDFVLSNVIKIPRV